MSKFAELIHVKKGLCGSAQLNRNTSPDQITAILSLIEDNCNMLKEISDALDTDGNLDSFLKNCQEEVVRSFLGADLLQLYKGVYFERGLGFQEMLKNLKNILKVPSQEQISAQARADFNQLTRRTDIDESFTQFLGRLKNEVAKFWTQEAYATVLVEERFKNSLRDIDKTFLLMLTHDKTGAQKLPYEAKMLDEKGLHKRNVNQVNQINAASQAEASVAALADSVTEFIRNEAELRRKEAENREKRDEKRWAEIEARIDSRLAHTSTAPFLPQPNMLQQPQFLPQAQMTPHPFYSQQVHNIEKVQPQQTRNPRPKPLKTACLECGSGFLFTENSWYTKQT